MKTLLPAALTLCLCFSANSPTVSAQDDAAKAVPMKQVPTPGRFEIQVTSGDREKTFSHPSKALSEIGRAVSRAKRAKEGEEPIFEAVLTLNDQTFTFNDPEGALEACKGVIGAMRDLPKLKMGLGDLGEIPEVEADQQPAVNPMPKGKSKAAAVAEVRRRIQIAMRKQMAGRPTIPNPLTMQKIVQQEVEKARKEGLLPSAANNRVQVPDGFAIDPREARKEVIVQTLALSLAQADSVGNAEEEPTGDEPGDEKPANENGEEKPAADQPPETKPAEEKPVVPDAPE